MNLKNLILIETVGNFANFRVRCSFCSVSICYYPQPRLASWLDADDEISAHRDCVGRGWEGVGGGAGLVFPTEWHWMIRRVRGRGRRNILLSGEYLGVLFVFRESLTASYERVHSVKPMYHGTTAISELHKKLNINHWTDPLLTNINLILATEFY